MIISKIRSLFRRKKYAEIDKLNRAADRKVIDRLGLSRQFTDDYTAIGTSSGDIAFLHDYIKRHRPRRVIEFGSGKSTWIIAKCMERYCWSEYSGDIQFVSMEESQYWHDQHVKFLPKESFEHFDEFVTMVCSKTENYQCKFISGLAYRDTPIEHFDFCFVDGPEVPEGCDMDFVKLVVSSDKPMTALIDKRKRTQIAYAALFGKTKMKRYQNGLCLIENITQRDLQGTNYKDIFPENESILRFSQVDDD